MYSTYIVPYGIQKHTCIHILCFVNKCKSNIHKRGNIIKGDLNDGKAKCVGEKKSGSQLWKLSLFCLHSLYQFIPHRTRQDYIGDVVAL